jgi:hypothetical protein
MKINNINPTLFILAVIIVSLIFVCGNTNAQPGYRYSPRMRMQPNRSVIVPNPPPQNYRQDYNQNIQTDGGQPFISFSIHFDPLLSWFSTDSYDTRTSGVVPGFNFGISYNKYFSPNYSFSSGINIINAGGRLMNKEISQFELKNYYGATLTIQPGEEIIYRITYLSIPLGLKLQTNQFGYGRFFTDIGIDPKIVLGGRADIPSLEIKGGNALPELNLFNLSFHIIAGMEYPLVGNNSLIFGVGFEKNLFDITRDNGDQPSNVVLQKMLSFRIGMTF